MYKDIIMQKANRNDKDENVFNSEWIQFVYTNENDKAQDGK